MLKQEKGYTLLELISVVVILATLAILVAPAFSSFWPGYQVDRSAREVMSLARRARDLAASEYVRYQLNLDLVSGEYWVRVESDPLRAPGIFEELGTDWGRKVLSERVRFHSILPHDQYEGQTKIITFYPDGSADEALIILASVTDNPMEEVYLREIEVRALTGQVKILPYE